MSADRSTVNVLHVDDDPQLSELASKMLAAESDRIVTETVESADEALDRLEPGAFDCVVSDYEMPRMDGIEFLRAVRARDRSLPFILFTGKGSEEVASEAISAGVTEYLQKRGGRDTYAILAHRIENAVDAHRASTRAENRQRRLEQILKTVPGGVVQLDRDGQIVLANDRAEEVLDLSTPAFDSGAEGDSARRSDDTDGDPVVDEDLPVDRVVESGAPVYGVRRTIDWPNGTRTVLRVNGAPVFDGAGDVESVVFSLTDVTDHLDQRRELASVQSRLEALVGNLPVVLFGVDEDGVFTLSEGQGLDALAVDPGEVVGRRVADVYDHPDIHRDLERALDGQSVEGRYTIDEAVFDVVYRPVEGSSVGTVVVGVARDVTEQRRREVELRRSRQQYQALVDNFPNGGVFLFDADLRYTLAGGEGLSDVGLSSADFEGKRPNDLFPADIAAELEDAYRAALDGETRVFEQSYQGGHYRVRVVPVGGDDSPTDVGLAVSEDITERREQRQALRRQNERLEEFVDVLSHDLRNPLNVATGRLTLAREECDSEHLDDIDTALDRCLELISDLLTFAQEGTATIDTEPVSLPAVVDECWQTVETGDATLSVDAAGRIVADESRLKQVFENLIRNAVDHGDPGVEIVVEALPDGFAVTDDGPGIPADRRDNVFEAGYSTATGGTGFGLSIVQRIADSHGWSITVTEGGAGGARFEVTGVESA
ncbi:PAS domain-containing protein [Halobaculum marinum]|uniref:histidine kinase n=1 Tax=Halobaculum marinum TaxID=3031996 RepID=A0ABD5WU58_9EURY|nr:PAS domain-containing protein [Halobaculum sp. DT55]